ncbi:MAG: hypothetical protein IPH80_35085 [Myxococcales bacterium]|nr:hypothetical protein [Myxococcales bacterium]
MRRPVAAALLVIVAACGGAPLPDEPVARGKKADKQVGKKHGSEAVREAEDPDAVARGGKKWGGWRYAGSRDECFYVVGRKCFATEAAACKAAGCGRGKCAVSGGGPANVKCR